MSSYITVGDFLQEVRERWGDTTCSASDKMLISFLNTALRRLARERGIDKLFTFRDTFELASISSDGTPSHQWKLNGDVSADKCIGAILDIYSLNVIGQDGCSITNTTPCYKEYSDFLKCNPLPQANEAGEPGSYTISNIGGQMNLIFDRPISGAKTVDIYYSAILPRLRNNSEIIRIPWGYLDIIVEMVIIYANMESGDYMASRALYEDVDALIDDLRELLHKQPDSAPFRRMNRSF